MAIKVNFSGVPCYDFIQYVARVLYCSGYSVLLVDFSNDRSLEESIPIPSGILQGHTIDYCGLRYAKDYYIKYELEYDYILYYYGQGAITHMKAHWQFVLVNSEEHSINCMLNEVSKYELYNLVLYNSSKEEAEYPLDNSYPVVVYLDMVTRKKELIKSKLSDSLSENFKICELTYNDYELRLLSQTENVVRFSKLSTEYKELIKQCCLALLRCDEDKEFLQKYKLAERGK